MGFNKRFITKNKILSTNDSDLDILFSEDALIMDDWSSKFLKLYEQGKNKNNILTLLDNDAQQK
jgi:hypothetical protein